MTTYCQYCDKPANKGHFNGAYTQYIFRRLNLDVCLTCAEELDILLKEAQMNAEEKWLANRFKHES